MKIGPDMKPYFVQYQASKAKKHLTLKQRSVQPLYVIPLFTLTEVNLHA